MDGFEPVTLSWQGREFIVPADRQLALIARLEDALQGDGDKSAIEMLFRKGGPPHSALARAFGAALRYAGAQVTDDQVYLSIHTDIASGSAQMAYAKTASMIVTLLAVISPPTFKASTAAAKENETAKKPKAAATSKRSTG